MKKSELLRKFLMVGLLFIFFSCDKDEFINDNSGKSIPVSDIGGENNKELILLGPKVAMGNGSVFSWVRIVNNLTPVEIGIEMTPEVLNNLPKESGFINPVIVPLPDIATEITPFNHIGINWNPENFSDIQSFKKAHFIFYFYTISLNDRKLIPAWSEETELAFSTYPPKNYMPADYVPLIKGIGSYAETGRHWLPQDPKRYSPFSHTFTFGTYKGELVFMSQVVSFEFLKSVEKTNNLISQPLYYPINKPFPKEYAIFINKNENYSISLKNFNHR